MFRLRTYEVFNLALEFWRKNTVEIINSWLGLILSLQKTKYIKDTCWYLYNSYSWGGNEGEGLVTPGSHGLCRAMQEESLSFPYECSHPSDHSPNQFCYWSPFLTRQMHVMFNFYNSFLGKEELGISLLGKFFLTCKECSVCRLLEKNLFQLITVTECTHLRTKYSMDMNRCD